MEGISIDPLYVVWYNCLKIRLGRDVFPTRILCIFTQNISFFVAKCHKNVVYMCTIERGRQNVVSEKGKDFTA